MSCVTSVTREFIVVSHLLISITLMAHSVFVENNAPVQGTFMTNGLVILRWFH